MFSLKAHNFYDVSKLIHSCSKLLGLTSFSIKTKGNVFEASTNLFNAFCIAFSTLTNLIFIFKFVSKQDNFWVRSKVEASELSRNIMIWVVLSFLIVSTLVNWWTFVSQKHFPSFLNLLVEVDEELARINLPVNLSRHKRIIFLTIAMYFVSSSICMCLTASVGRGHDYYQLNFFFIFTVSCSMIQNMFLIFQFTFLLLAVKLRYKKINSFLKTSFLDSWTTNLQEGNDKLCVAAKLHDKLVDVSDLINRCYAVPVSYLKQV